MAHESVTAQVEPVEPTCIYCDGPINLEQPTGTRHQSMPLRPAPFCRVCGEVSPKEPPKEGLLSLRCVKCRRPIPFWERGRQPCRDCRGSWQEYFRGKVFWIVCNSGMGQHFFTTFNPDALDPAFRHYACELFGHSTFTKDTWDRFWWWVRTEPPGGPEKWIRTRSPGDLSGGGSSLSDWEILQMPQADLLAHLKAAAEEAKRNRRALVDQQALTLAMLHATPTFRPGVSSTPCEIGLDGKSKGSKSELREGTWISATEATEVANALGQTISLQTISKEAKKGTFESRPSERYDGTKLEVEVGSFTKWARSLKSKNPR
ncbi:MAG: hypothetical protein JO252_25620 [Planctomycetaceae bacterium]|nr:hypothetical protein [Planctomycetaceae bacterium]